VRKEQEEDGLKQPEDLFSINFFKGLDQGRAFARRARHVMPDARYKPTLTHHFLKLLQDSKQRPGHGPGRSILKRVFTQNIDTLEKQAGVKDDVLVHAHGSFGDAHCIECRKQMRLPSWRKAVTQVKHLCGMS
jgi:NAD-dependent SIR2 family protein deacetylase